MHNKQIIFTHALHQKYLQVLMEECNCGFESTLFPCLDRWIRQVSTDSETMVTTSEVLALIILRELATTSKDIICSPLVIPRELRVCLTRIDKEGCFRLFFVPLEMNVW